ncbi:MAG: preprotein translocase subunit SecY [Deltaproteobacteria bacterium CG11_big_fil_rev_8_21_14_0_20_45_16]|nr:MAG: preprotein translocase subunit SecY [Deltaproteobacteria bacterium CG11_big_fil_rev_8_21_14_0_20_45_16]
MSNKLVSAARAPELIKKLWVTFGLLAIYRMGIFVPTPGVNGDALKRFITEGANLFGVFNAFSGGALERFSVFALGIMPYISSSIIFSLLTVVSPRLSQLQKEGGELGRKKINQYTRYGTILIAVVQAFGIASWLQSNPGGMEIVNNPGLSFKLLTVVTLTAGTCFIMWLGEQISQRGIGNGTSLIIFASIVSGMPSAVGNLWEKVAAGEMRGGDFFMFIVLAVAITGVIVFFERAQRRIPIHHAKKVVGRKMYGASMQFLPLKVNMAGVIPPIFASSILLFPGTMAQFLGARFPQLNEVAVWFQPGNWMYNTLYVVGIVFFCYFYTAIQFNPEDVADNVKKSGGFVPGIRPGKNTADYIDHVLTRLTTCGAVYISAICILPFFFFDSYQVFLGGTSILIVVGVAMNFVEQVQTHLMAQRYDSLLNDSSGTRTSRFRVRKGA